MPPRLADSFEHTAVNVSGKSVEVLAANPARKSALFVNDSEVIMYLKFSATAVLNEGIRLNGFGGSYELTIQSGTMIVGEVNAISTSDGRHNLTILERSNPK